MLTSLMVVTLQGDEEMTKDFFVQEIEAYSGLLYRIAFTILRNDDACKDALQDTALKAWEKRSMLREEKYFRTWITRILINTCYDTQRKRRRIVSIEEVPEPIASPPDPTLAFVLKSLPDKLRLPIMLYYMEGMSYEEITEALHIPMTTLRSRLHYAKKELRKELDAE